MTVKQLIKKLLEMPMDAKVIISAKDKETAEYTYAKAEHIVEYYDGSVGVFGEEMQCDDD